MICNTKVIISIETKQFLCTEWVCPYLTLSASISLCVLEASLGMVTLPTWCSKHGEAMGYNLLQCAVALGLYDSITPLKAKRLPALSSHHAQLVV